ncbi:hypothetical protein [Trichloromonas sp.]|uniref:hypothetical protein n=1 Tax=Trichloromonas sp. TaxID=3069249 RepID=UPI002A380806|nr:hypothetical protein [Trichloromonas sp.]
MRTEYEYGEKNVFYVKKTKDLKLFNNSIIKIYNCTNSEDFYEVKINYDLYKRLVKLNKISKSEKIDNIIKMVDYIEKNMTSFNNIFEHELVKELTKEIDKQILKNLLDLK